jgi:hypothetical protein
MAVPRNGVLVVSEGDRRKLKRVLPAITGAE